MDNGNLPELIAAVAGIAITLALAYVPGLKQRWEKLDGVRKRAWLGVLYVAAGVGLYVPSCFGGPQVLACDTSSIWNVVFAVILALIAGQGMYQVLPSRTKRRMSSDPKLEIVLGKLETVPREVWTE